MIAPNKTHHRTIDLKLWWKLVLHLFYRWQNWESVNLKNMPQVTQMTHTLVTGRSPELSASGPRPVCVLQSSTGHPGASQWSVVLSLLFRPSLTCTRDPFLPPATPSPHTFHTRPRPPPVLFLPLSLQSLSWFWEKSADTVGCPNPSVGCSPCGEGEKQQQTTSYYWWGKKSTYGTQEVQGLW